MQQLFLEKNKEKIDEIGNIYTEIFQIFERAFKSFETSNKKEDDKHALLGVAYEINHIQKDRMPENTGEIDEDMKPLTFMCLVELSSEYPEPVRIFYENFFHEGDYYMRDEILDIFAKYNRTERDMIFGKYSEYINAATGTLNYMQHEFDSGATIEECYVEEYYSGINCRNNHNNESLVHFDVSAYFIQRANDFLKRFIGNKEFDFDVESEVKSADVEIELFKYFFKELKNKNSISIYNTRSIKFDVCSGQELERDKKKMKQIYLENYKNFPQKFKDRLILSLESRLKNKKAKFYILRHKNEVVAFNSFLPQDDGTLHFANFNVDPNYQFSKLGEALMEISLDLEAKKADIVAEVVPNTKIMEVYLNKKGFKKINEIEVCGVKLWKIKRNKEA